MENRSSSLHFITIEGYVEVSKYGHLYFVIMFAAYLLTLCSNTLIISLIWTHPNLHEPMYVFIAALSVNSIVYASAIYPKLMIDFVSEKQVVSLPVCLFQWFTYYTLGACEFMLLTAMAYDRYVSICKPLQYPTIMTKTKVCVLLALAWLLPFSQNTVALCLNVKKKLCHVAHMLRRCLSPGGFWGLGAWLSPCVCFPLFFSERRKNKVTYLQLACVLVFLATLVTPVVSMLFLRLSRTRPRRLSCPHGRLCFPPPPR